MRKTGTYAALVQGVSQQTPQQRTDGQLSEQINMTSDIVTGLRRRTGFAYQYTLQNIPSTSWFDIVELNGTYYLQSVDKLGYLRIYNLETGVNVRTLFNPYFTFNNKASIRSTILGNAVYIINTEKTPTKNLVTTGSPNFDPATAGWLHIKSGAFAKSYTVTIARSGAATFTFTVTTDVSSAAMATSEYVATTLRNQMIANSAFTAIYDVHLNGTLIGIKAKAGTGNAQVVVSNNVGDTYMTTSEGGVLTLKTLLPAYLPFELDTYIMGVGTGRNLAYYQYNHTTRTWKEAAIYEPRYEYTNIGFSWYFEYTINEVVTNQLKVKGRSAGDDDSNPVPEFFDYGITGISSYQSRLVILSGAYVNMSRSNDPTVFMRTTVTELLDDDAIEISATSLSNTQFEYAIPYNKDLVLFARNQQAVIPNNSTVLTPKTAVIYPTTTSDVSLACAPTVISRSLYYTYLRGGGSVSYQVGELLPSPYTDSQYSTQSTTDHIPLYATGVCTCMSGSTAGNLAMFSNDSSEVLVNQFYWVGDERPLMAYHKWVLASDIRVHYHKQVNDRIIVVASKDGSDSMYVLATDLQLNQLTSKPVPYLDMYSYIQLDADGLSDSLPIWYNTFLASDSLVVVQYSSTNLRYMELEYTIQDNRLVVPEGANELIILGLKYPSSIELTPPFIRDSSGGVISGTRSTLQSLTFTFKDTSAFTYQVWDAYGTASAGDTFAPSWSEVDLGRTWISDVTTSVIPCRVRLNSAKIVVSTTSTTDMNVLTVEYSVRIPDRDVRSRR